MKVLHGDLLALARRGDFDVIAHGCNCFCAFGKGLALTIKREFPAAYAADCATTKGDASKLGTCSTARVDVDGASFTIVNAYTQFHWRKGPKPVADYDAIRKCMRWLRANYAGARVGVPRIGAGLALGDWTVISAIIDEELAGQDVTLVEYASSH
ncbi:MAG TPA: phosphatase [Myxococcota bacterium]|jgi:O-acetyl-ADP-ribose deacetylase (regulator of RNase III)